MSLIRHLCTKILIVLFKASWGYKSMGNIGPRCSIWFPLCHLPTNWPAFYSCYNNRDSISYKRHCPLLVSNYCYVTFLSTPVEIVCNSLHGLLRFYAYLILLIHFNVFPSGLKHIFFLCHWIISRTYGILLKSHLTLLPGLSCQNSVFFSCCSQLAESQWDKMAWHWILYVPQVFGSADVSLKSS